MKRRSRISRFSGKGSLSNPPDAREPRYAPINSVAPTVSPSADSVSAQAEARSTPTSKSKTSQAEEQKPPPPQIDLESAVSKPTKIPRNAANKILLLGQPKDVFASLLTSTDAFANKPAFRISQVYDAIYRTGVESLDDITTLQKAEREALSAKFAVHDVIVRQRALSEDGTRKWLLGFDGTAGKAAAECVFIPDNAGGTVCVSSQVGCSLACSFCHTGTQKLLRNLSAGEIVAQVMHAMREVGDFPLSSSKPRNVTNIVMMGQGEPLLNFRNVATAIRTFSTGLGLSPHRTTLSTSGVAPLLSRVGSELGCGLAISLHAVTDALRDELVPLNKTYPIAEVLRGVKAYLSALKHNPAVPAHQHGHVTFEYVLLKAVNDAERDARELARIVRRFPGALVNLIPFNPWPGSNYETSDEDAVRRFQVAVKDAGVRCTVRAARGTDIMGACGQLKSAADEKKGAKRGAAVS
ncbi:putative pyruvate formate lyase activating enzyme 2 [Zopfochytrium polystomum]|nr:putative pyruvate formate lyase activating enzyme 2 [Zopfochytrium polystomum]